MKVLTTGRTYALTSFEGGIPQTLQFIQTQPLNNTPGETGLVTVSDGTTNEEVLRVLIDAEGSVDEAVAASGAPSELVGRIARMLDRAQFKRDQAAVILKLAPRAFGRGRRYPIAQRWDWSR